MPLPYFYVEQLDQRQIVLNEDTSKHVVSVLRMQRGEAMLLTDGKGQRVRAEIIDDNRKRCTVQTATPETEEKRTLPAIGISLIKNASRFEWFLEKATEIGVSEILPLLCDRTEKEKFRHDRLNGILISAMLQSQQCWLPVLHEPLPFSKAILSEANNRFIAHCLPGEKNDLSSEGHNRQGRSLLLIGPEGDFTPAEIEAALKQEFRPVSLGATRLRTETAALVGLVQLQA